jgi:hypothetical protein
MSRKVCAEALMSIFHHPPISQPHPAGMPAERVPPGVGILIALGFSLALWAMLISGGVALWSLI